MCLILALGKFTLSEPLLMLLDVLASRFIARYHAIWCVSQRVGVDWKLWFLENGDWLASFWVHMHGLLRALLHDTERNIVKSM